MVEKDGDFRVASEDVDSLAEGDLAWAAKESMRKPGTGGGRVVLDFVGSA